MSDRRHALFLVVLYLAGFVGLFLAADRMWPAIGIDWRETFYPVGRAILEGKSPYTIPTFRNTPWASLILIPFALFSERIGGILFFIAVFGSYAWSAYRLQASRLALCAFLLSPPVVYGLRMLNVDSFVLLGFTLPPMIGLFLVLIKPQMGLGLAIYWLVLTWRQGGLKQTVLTFAPVSIVTLFSFVFFGNWLAGRQADLPGSLWDASLWPWGLPIGVVLLAVSMRDRREHLAMAASPFLSPYLAYHSWSATLAGWLRRDFELVVAVVAMWLVAIIRVFEAG